MEARDLVDPFARYARAAGAQVTLVADSPAAAAVVLATTAGPLRCTAAVRDRYPTLVAALAAAGRAPSIAEDLAGPAVSRAALAAALAGATGLLAARAGVAETGSLLLADDGLAPRLLGMLADVCVALLPAAAIVPGLDAAGALLQDLERAGHRYVPLVTGPSRTADIERVLTIGVQGPKALHILVLSEDEAEAR